MAIKVVDIADEIFRESFSDDSISIPFIAFWVRANIGLLNNLIGADFSINETTLEITPDLTEEEKSIFKLLFEIYFVKFKIKESLGASAIESVLEISDFGTTVRKSNRTELGKTWLSLRKDLQSQLDGLILIYYGKRNQVRPIQVSGDDIFDNNCCNNSCSRC